MVLMAYFGSIVHGITSKDMAGTRDRDACGASRVAARADYGNWRTDTCSRLVYDSGLDALARKVAKKLDCVEVSFFTVTVLIELST